MFREMKEKFKQNASYHSHEDILTLQLSSMFEYDCEELETEFIELYLILFGECAIWKLDGKLIVSYCTRAGKPDPNGLGSDLICTTGNGVSKTFQNFKDSDEVVYIKNNKYAVPDTEIDITASMFTEIDTSVRYNVKNSRLQPVILAKNALAKSAIEAAMRENAEGAYKVILTEEQFLEGEGNSVEVVHFTDVKDQDKIQYLNKAYDDFLRRFYNHYGLDTCGAGKMAQQSVEEINSGCNSRLIIPLERLEERRKGMDACNTKFGVTYSVKFSEPWEREFAINVEPTADEVDSEEVEEVQDEVVEEKEEKEDENL